MAFVDIIYMYVFYCQCLRGYFCGLFLFRLCTVPGTGDIAVNKTTQFPLASGSQPP